MKASRYFAMFCNIVCCLSAVCFFKRFERVFLDLSLLRISQWPQQSVFFFRVFASDVLVSRAVVDCL